MDIVKLNEAKEEKYGRLVKAYYAFTCKKCGTMTSHSKVTYCPRCGKRVK